MQTIMLAALFILIGAALGLRLRAFVLVPTAGVAIASVVLVNEASASANSLPTQVLATVAVIIASQVGYLLGIGVRSVTGHDRFQRNRDGWLVKQPIRD